MHLGEKQYLQRHKMIYIYIPEKGEDESQRETNMVVVQDWEEKIAEHLLLNACSFRGACINAE